MNVGAAIRFQREKNGLSQKELAQMLNVSNKTVSSWEANRTEPKMDMIEKMCDIFHCKKSEFLGDIFPDGPFDIRFRTNFGELVASFTPQRQSLFTALNKRAEMLDDEDLARVVEIMNVFAEKKNEKDDALDEQMQDLKKQMDDTQKKIDPLLGDD